MTDLEVLATARARHAAAKDAARKAMAANRNARDALTALEREHLEDVAQTGDVDACLRELAAAETVVWVPELMDVIHPFLEGAVPGNVVVAANRVLLEGRHVLVPVLDNLGPAVPAEAGAALLALLDRWATLFAYTDEVDLEIDYGATNRYLTVTRSTGEATLHGWNPVREEEQVYARGHIGDVLRCAD